MGKSIIKKILIVTIEPFPHGMAGTNRIISLSKGFIANGLDVQILSMYKFGEPYDIIINPKKGVYEGIKFTNIYNSTVKNKYKIIRAFNELSKPVLVFHFCLQNVDRYTLVYYYSEESLPAIAAKIAASMKSSVIVKEETEHPSVRVSNKRKLNKYLFLKYHYKIFDGLFVITHNLYEYFKEVLNYKKPIFVVPMIVDIDRFNNRLSTNNNSIVFSGILDDQKEGVDLLIRAVSRVIKIYPNYTLHLYGNAMDDAQENRYKRMISELNVEKTVIMHGYKIRDEMTDIFLKAGILVFTRPSSLQAAYGFSTKLGEYLAAGKPVLATRVGEIEAYLKDRKNAFICNPNEESIANKLCEIIEDSFFASKVAEEGRLCAIEHFNNKTETKKAIAHLHDICNETFRR